jgi:hypothetical protein
MPANLSPEYKAAEARRSRTGRPIATGLLHCGAGRRCATSRGLSTTSSSAHSDLPVSGVVPDSTGSRLARTTWSPMVTSSSYTAERTHARRDLSAATGLRSSSLIAITIVRRVSFWGVHGAMITENCPRLSPPVWFARLRAFDDDVEDEAFARLAVFVFALAGGLWNATTRSAISSRTKHKVQSAKYRATYEG